MKGLHGVCSSLRVTPHSEVWKACTSMQKPIRVTPALMMFDLRFVVCRIEGLGRSFLTFAAVAVVRCREVGESCSSRCRA